MKHIYPILFFILMGVSLGLSSKKGFAQQGNEKPIISNQERNITVYPIPANNIANIRLSPMVKNETAKIEIINLIGRKMVEQTILDHSANDITFSNIGELPQGIYMVVARDKFGKIIQSAKMIVNR